MKQQEIVGGIYVSLPIREKQFFDSLVTYMKRKNIDKLPVDRFNDRQREIVLSLIKFNVLNYDGKYIWIRK